MERCVISSVRPWDLVDHYQNYSIMIINPAAPDFYKQYLLEKSDYSLLVTDHGTQERPGGDYPGEKLLWYTSGTTGNSKFYSFTAEQKDILANTICRDYDLGPNDRYFGIMPLWHSHGQGMFWALKRAKAQCEFGSITNHQDRERMLALQPTFISAIPDMMSIVLRMQLTSLRFVRTASSALPDSLHDRLKEKFDVPVIEAFGMTESLSHCFTNPLQGEQRKGTVGLPSGIEAMVQDQRLLIKGPCLFSSGWHDTGDLVEQDAHGYFRILGRHIDQINVLGMKINPLDVENYLMNRVEGIEQCVVFGQDKLKCLIIGSVDLNMVKKELSTLGNQYKPFLLQTVDQIPKNNVGKISRKTLDQLF